MFTPSDLSSLTVPLSAGAELLLVCDDTVLKRCLLLPLVLQERSLGSCGER
jgi:hypothetical protein